MTQKKPIRNFPLITNTFTSTYNRYKVLSHLNEVNRYYYVDSSQEHKNYIENFDSSKYKQIHILGNSPCLNKIPESIFEDNSNYIIGLNRSYIRGRSNILLWRDKSTIRDIIDEVREERKPYNDRIRDTRIIQCGMGIPKMKSVTKPNPVEGQPNIAVWELRQRYNTINIAGRFLTSIANYCKHIDNEELPDYPKPDITNHGLSEDGSGNPLWMCVSVCNAALHLVTQLFDKHTPIFLHGVSYDKRRYFYGDDKTVNKVIARRTDIKNGNDRYGFERDTSFEDTINIIENYKFNNDEEGMHITNSKLQHKIVCYYMLRYMMFKDYKIYYSAESQILDYMASKFEDIKKVSYE